MKTKTLFAALICAAILTSCESKPHIRRTNINDLDSILKKRTSNEEPDESASSTNNVSDMNPTWENCYPSAPDVQPGTTDYPERQPHEEYCRACRGTGTCHACNGTGQQVSEMSIAADKTIYRNCSACNGTGHCGGCGGDGVITEGIDF